MPRELLGCPIFVRGQTTFAGRQEFEDEHHNAILRAESGALRELSELASDMAEKYEWDHAQACLFILHDITPLLSESSVRPPLHTSD